jgi:hypothetical protein
MIVLYELEENGRSQAVTARCGSAGQAGEPGGRMAVAARAPRGELRRGDAEDSGQLTDFTDSETPLPMAFGAANGGSAQPAHHLAKLGLSPSVALAEGTDVRADNSALLRRDLAGKAAPPPRHAPASFVRTA